MRWRCGWRSKRGLKNFSVLVSHVLVPPSITSILQAPGNRVQGFLGPGHVCTVMGCSEYEPIAQRYHVPIVITGFEPVDMLEGVLLTVQQLEAGEARGGEPVRPGRAARGQSRNRSKLIEEVFEICDRKWRGVGIIPKSGYKLRYEYRDHDAERLFEVDDIETRGIDASASAGRCCEGLKKPHDCPAFGKALHAADAAGRDDGLQRRARAPRITRTGGTWKRAARAAAGRSWYRLATRRDVELGEHAMSQQIPQTMQAAAIDQFGGAITPHTLPVPQIDAG